MNPRRMSKSICSYNCFIGLNRHRHTIETSWLVSYNFCELILVSRFKYGCWRNIMTTSSKEVFPARSPIPFIVHSIWRAPFWTPEIEFAVARPKSLWQWQDRIALWIPTTLSFKNFIFWPYSSGKQYPVVSGIFRTVAPALITSSQIRAEIYFQFFLHLPHKIQHHLHTFWHDLQQLLLFL